MIVLNMQMLKKCKHFFIEYGLYYWFLVGETKPVVIYIGDTSSHWLMFVINNILL